MKTILLALYRPTYNDALSKVTYLFKQQQNTVVL